MEFALWAALTGSATPPAAWRASFVVDVVGDGDEEVAWFKDVDTVSAMVKFLDTRKSSTL